MKQHYSPEEIINSLDKLQKASPSPFLYAKIQSRREQASKAPEVYFFRFITRPAFALAIAFVFLLMHGYLLVNRMKTEISPEDTNNLIAAEYVLHDANPYELNETP